MSKCNTCKENIPRQQTIYASDTAEHCYYCSIRNKAINELLELIEGEKEHISSKYKGKSLGDVSEMEYGLITGYGIVIDKIKAIKEEK